MLHVCAMRCLMANTLQLTMRVHPAPSNAWTRPRKQTKQTRYL
jgi:hypothetical protein